MTSDGTTRLRLPRGRAADAALAIAAFLLSITGTVQAFVGGPDEPWATTVLGWLLIAVACAALYVRRRHPVAVAALVFAATCAYYLTSIYDGPLLATLVVALYTVAAQGRLQAAVALSSLTVISVGAGTLAGNREIDGLALFLLTGWLVAVVALGWVAHSRRVYFREVRQRAASEERLRIARELHDVVGHHMSLINVQAAAALHRIGRDPAQAETALGAIKESSREALRELRATLGVLRQADEDAPTAPAPGLDRLAELVRSAEQTGLRVRVDGAPGPLPTEVDLAAYRIVQESLTNVARHAHARTVTVRLGDGPGEVTVEVEDDGHGPVPGSSGTGIGGMRERARALGGELTAGPRPGGGFAVRARLPRRNGASAR
ncbi:Signal transduction histidine kinase [Thermomonospora echinospora]|uniref:histidine kinase n=1 Tax=Thermomonospora echinospora TaxID=1992 RepID=A0A1H5T135_9ACTN|nr:sensor histidine kinase [Thermomonospora echinospora]SEF56486.1 Signal transduction histidine kinase [Thermomonospora echinospora]